MAVLSHLSLLTVLINRKRIKGIVDTKKKQITYHVKVKTDFYKIYD